MRTSWLKCNGDALKGLKVSNVGGGKDALQEVFRRAMNEARLKGTFQLDVESPNLSCMKDKCCRHETHYRVKCKRLKRSLLNEQIKLSMTKEVNECTHGNYSSKCEKCPIIQNSDKLLCVHGICSSTCEKCLRQKNNVIIYHLSSIIYHLSSIIYLSSIYHLSIYLSIYLSI